MKNARNKEELYKLLISYLHARSKEIEDATMCVTNNAEVLSNKGHSFMERSNHIEADTRMVLFVEHALNSGLKRVLVRTGDTDVIFILLGQCRHLLGLNADLQLVVEMRTTSTGKEAASTGYIDIVNLANSIGIDRSVGILLLHAYTGCDYTLSFFSIGKA